MAGEGEDMEFDMAEESDFDDEEVVVGELHTEMVPKRIKKRSLKNKALAIEFNDKALKDFVTGFHKRKKKRRKEAQRQLQEKERLRRIEARKKRKQEQLAVYGILPSSKDHEANSEADDGDDADHEQEKFEDTATLSGTQTYEDGNMMITVTTSELTQEDDILKQQVAPKLNRIAKGTVSLAVKKKPLKRMTKYKSRRKGGKKQGFQKKDKRKTKNGH